MTDQLFPADAGVRRLSLVRLSSEIARSMIRIGRVVVEGEVHRPQTRPGGTLYFTLRDRVAQLSVRCPGSRARSSYAVDGERVSVTGRVVLDSFRGQVLLEAEEVVPVGAGAAAALIAQTRGRLADEGLLDRPRRRLPLLPDCVGVVCGADAAVRADIEAVANVRYPGYPLLFEEVSVSGPGAASDIIAGLNALDARREVQVIVLARGGGDAAQLLPFSDEDVCRAICATRVPVVSAVGHEGDRPLCDEVADARFGTPSIAATAVIPDRVELQERLDALLTRAHETASRGMDRAATRLRSVDREAAVRGGLAIARGRLQAAEGRMTLVHPRGRLATALDALSGLRARMEALDPRRVLERGYAIVRAGDGTVVRSGSSAAVGEQLDVELGDGGLRVTVGEVLGG